MSLDAPRCKNGKEKSDITVSHGNVVSLSCELKADPDDSLRFSWTHNSTRGDVLPIRSPPVRIRNVRLTSVLEYKLESDNDFGTLACWAINSVGKQRTPCIFNIAFPGE